jgi:hypothetical protein
MHMTNPAHLPHFNSFMHPIALHSISLTLTIIDFFIHVATAPFFRFGLSAARPDEPPPREQDNHSPLLSFEAALALSWSLSLPSAREE